MSLFWKVGKYNLNFVLIKLYKIQLKVYSLSSLRYSWFNKLCSTKNSNWIYVNFKLRVTSFLGVRNTSRVLSLLAETRMSNWNHLFLPRMCEIWQVGDEQFWQGHFRLGVVGNGRWRNEGEHVAGQRVHQWGPKHVAQLFPSNATSPLKYSRGSFLLVSHRNGIMF